jgi:hypothetical protein
LVIRDGSDGFTVTVTAAGLLLVASLLSLTVRENFKLVSDDTLGAVNDAVVVYAPFSTTDGPSVCLHE